MVAWNTTDGGIAVVAGARTPFAKAGTALRREHVTDLAKRAMQEALYRANFPFGRVDEVLLGNVVMPVDATNPARVSALWAGVPQRVPAMTVQRNCASGMEAVAEATDRIRAGRGRAILAGGAESMSTLPLLFPEETLEPMSQLARAKHVWQKAAAVAALRPRHFKPIAALERGLTDPTCDMIMGRTAELLANEFAISPNSRTSSPCARTSAPSPPSRRENWRRRSSPSTPAIDSSRSRPTPARAPIRRSKRWRSSSRFSTGATEA